MNEHLKVLFISRAYPPVTGGIEKQNYELSAWLPKYSETRTIANTRGKILLPLFLPYATIKALMLFRKYDVVLLGDGVLGIVGWILKIFYNKPVASVIHGLDLTYNLWIYKKLWVGFFIPKLDKLIAVGNETIRQGIRCNIPEEKFIFVPNGVGTGEFVGNYFKSDLERITKLDLRNKKIILTLGRLARRKGVAWFVNNVVPKLDENILYFVAGEGEDKENIKKNIIDNNLQSRVKLFGNVTDEERKILYNTVDIFVQPNIPVENDMEGFGLVVLEAASCGRVVVASKLEGLQDAIRDGKNGFLVSPKDAEQYAKKINALANENELREAFGKRSREYVAENYSWEKISKKYLEILENL